MLTRIVLGLQADAIRRLTLQDVKDVFNAYIAHDGAERRKFSFHIYGNRTACVGDAHICTAWCRSALSLTAAAIMRVSLTNGQVPAKCFGCLPRTTVQFRPVQLAPRKMLAPRTALRFQQRLIPMGVGCPIHSLPTSLPRSQKFATCAASCVALPCSLVRRTRPYLGKLSHPREYARVV